MFIAGLLLLVLVIVLAGAWVQGYTPADLFRHGIAALSALWRKEGDE